MTRGVTAMVVAGDLLGSFLILLFKIATEESQAAS